MTFTEQEEAVLKLIVAETIARTKLNNVNQEMGDAIRAQFNTIDAQIRAQYKPVYEPLQQEVKQAQTNLKEFFK